MPHIFTSMSYNLWGEWDFESRREPLRQLMELRSPDLLGVQELSLAARDLIDATLPHHERVRDDAPGWGNRSNLWWDARAFAEIDHGLEDVGIFSEGAGLFWVRLRNLADPALPPLLLCSAHLTYQGHPREVETNYTPRVDQARAIGDAMLRLAGENPAILCVDANDFARPLWEMYQRGFFEPFGFMGRTCPPTHPVTPRFDRMRFDRTSPVEKCIDFQFFRGAIAPRCAEVVEFFADGTAPSDHKPVLAAFAYTDETDLTTAYSAGRLAAE
jgi:endonuclease/exonuclease/phosphatase family metal-dependent hydrolase